MGLIGRIPACFNDDCVRDMVVGDSAYVCYLDIILTKKALFLDCITSIIRDEELDDDEKDEYVLIRRIGPGLTQDDFEIDFTPHCDGLFQLEIEPESMYTSCMKDPNDFVVFHNPELDLSQKKDLPKEETDTESIEALYEQLKEATDKEDFVLAAKLRDKIKHTRRSL